MGLPELSRGDLQRAAGDQIPVGVRLLRLGLEDFRDLQIRGLIEVIVDRVNPLQTQSTGELETDHGLLRIGIKTFVKDGSIWR